MSGRRVLLRVLALAAGASVAAPGAAAGTRVVGSGPLVDAMVVGRTATLVGDRKVRAARARVRVGNRHCTIGGATPLAALIAARASGPAISLRDFGHCSVKPADAGQVFVSGVGSDRNHGRVGWEYKVGHRAGTTGAGDLSGAFGDGHRLHDGQRVLWFWCVLSAGDSCQRTLDVTPASPRVAVGAAVQVTVTGYDDAGRGVPVGGATVTLADSRAATDTQGRATLTAPALGGRYTVSATGAGLVPSFPEVINVG